MNFQEFQKGRYFRQAEQMADLFACDRLVKTKQINTLLSYIAHFAYSEGKLKPYVIAKGTRDKHPSDTERALYMLDFLDERMKDLPRVIENWEKKGACLPFNKATVGGGFDLTSQPALQAKKLFDALKIR